MTDFIEVESGHSMMRYNKDVAKKIMAFLKNGKFFRERGLIADAEEPVVECPLNTDSSR